jgi:hypothetical protein
VNSPYRMLEKQELDDRTRKVAVLPEQVIQHRRQQAQVPGLIHGRWRRHFEQAWTTLLLAKPDADPRGLVELAKKHADEAFAVTEPLRREAEAKAERVFYDGEDPG